MEQLNIYLEADEIFYEAALDNNFIDIDRMMS